MPVAPDVNIIELVSRTERFSGAEVSFYGIVEVADFGLAGLWCCINCYCYLPFN
jgi:hypothetical protein